MKKYRKIKVVEIIPTLKTGGAENVTKFICKYLDRSKFDLSLFCLYDTPKHNWPKNIDIIFFSKKRGFDPILTWRLRKKLLEKNPDIVHNHTLSSLLYLIPAILLAGKKKLVHTIHNDLRFYLGPLFWTIIFYLFKIYTVNLSSSLNIFLQKSPRNINIANGIELKKYLSVKSGNSSGKNILSIGRFENQKNPILLVRVFSNILRYDKNFHLTMVGTGSLEKRVRKEIKRLNLTKKIILVNQKVEPRIYFQFADYLMLTSRWEGMPLTIIEAMAAGLIVFTTPVGAIKDLISSGKNGFIFKDRSPREMAKFFINRSKKDIFISRCKKKAIKSSLNFSSKAMVTNYEKFFRTITTNNNVNL